MNDDNRTPSWGVMVRAPIEWVKYSLARLADRFNVTELVYCASGEWSAVFCMEQSSSSDGEAGDLLCSSGTPVYRFDFNKYEDMAWYWDGQSWHLDDDAPEKILLGVGLFVPGPDPEPFDANKATVARRASVLENAPAEAARQLVSATSGVVEDGRLGAVVYDPDVDTQIAFWQCAPARVFEVLFYPKIGEFWLTIMRGEDCLGTFRPGETRTLDGTPFLPDFEGETTAEGVLDKLGIPRSFLDPLPPKATDPGAGNK